MYINAHYTIEAEGLANTMDLADLEDGIGWPGMTGTWWNWWTPRNMRGFAMARDVG